MSIDSFDRFYNDQNGDNPFDQFDKGNPFDQFDEQPEPERTVLGTAGDVGLTALKGAISVPEAAVGLADIATGGRTGKFLKDTINFDPKQSKEWLDQHYSDAQKAANRRVSEADGFLDTATAMVKNPSTIAHTALESLPLMGAGGVVGRGAMALPKLAQFSPKLGQLVAAAIGEGAVGAGMAAEDIRNQNESQLLTGKQAAMAAASGVGTGLFNLIGGRIAKKAGFDDIDTMLVSGGVGKTSGNIAKRILAGGISEGALEEMPQSIQETIWNNAALDKPLLEGVPEAAAEALLVGGATGAGANLVSGVAGGTREDTEPDPTPESTPEPPKPPSILEQVEILESHELDEADLYKLLEESEEREELGISEAAVEEALARKQEQPQVGVEAIQDEEIKEELGVPETVGEMPEFAEPPQQVDENKPVNKSTPISSLRQNYEEKIINEIRKERVNGKEISIAEAKRRVAQREEKNIPVPVEEADEYDLSQAEHGTLSLIRATGKPTRLMNVKMDENQKSVLNSLVDKGLIQKNENGTYEAIKTDQQSAKSETLRDNQVGDDIVFAPGDNVSVIQEDYGREVANQVRKAFRKNEPISLSEATQNAQEVINESKRRVEEYRVPVGMESTNTPAIGQVDLTQNETAALETISNPKYTTKPTSRSEKKLFNNLVSKGMARNDGGTYSITEQGSEILNTNRKAAQPQTDEGNGVQPVAGSQENVTEEIQGVQGDTVQQVKNTVAQREGAGPLPVTQESEAPVSETNAEDQRRGVAAEAEGSGRTEPVAEQFSREDLAATDVTIKRAGPDGKISDKIVKADQAISEIDGDIELYNKILDCCKG